MRVSKSGVAVSDSGKGIHRDKLSNITKSYEKGDDSKGFGLGLAIVERLCSKLDWHLEIESAPGQGTPAKLVVPQPHRNKLTEGQRHKYFILLISPTFL